MKVLALLSAIFLLTNALPFGDHLVNAPKYNGTTWVVIVSGSNSWSNYEHQSNAYHAYQVVRNHGIPEKNIIIFHYDDIANNPENPNKGIVINQPNGTDVYHGVPKDYVGKDVTPENFLAAIKGDKELAKKGKKVLESGPNDHVFIYYTDHGSTNLVAFPEKYLYAKDLNEALVYMHKNNRYGKLVFYLEACESGSMFKNYITEDMHIYATTSTLPDETGWACYWDDNLEAYLSDYYSASWMEDSDKKKNLKIETLLQQFKIVAEETSAPPVSERSHPQQYGDLSIANLPLSQFQGPKVAKIGDRVVKPKITDAVEKGEKPVQILKNKIALAKNKDDKKKYSEQLAQLLTGRQYLVNHLQKFVERIESIVGNDVNSLMNDKRELTYDECYRKFVDTFNDQCFNINKNLYALRKLHIFANICEGLHENNAESYVDVLVNDSVGILANYCKQNLSNGYPILIN